MAKNSGNTRKKNSENIKEAQISSNLRALTVILGILIIS